MFAATFACLACSDPYPWEEAAGSAATPRPITSASAEPAGSADPVLDADRQLEGGLFSRCSAGFAPGHDPVRDVTKLALLCGPSTGMSRLLDGPQEGVVAAGGVEVRLPLALEHGRCYRVFAVADAGVPDLHVELRSSRGTVIASDSAEGRVAVVQADRALCPPAAEEATIVIRAAAGRGSFALEAWALDLGH